MKNVVVINQWSFVVKYWSFFLLLGSRLNPPDWLGVLTMSGLCRSVPAGSAVRNRLVHNGSGVSSWRESVWDHHPVHLLRPGREAVGSDPAAHAASLPSTAGWTHRSPVLTLTGPYWTRRRRPDCVCLQECCWPACCCVTSPTSAPPSSSAPTGLRLWGTWPCPSSWPEPAWASTPRYRHQNRPDPSPFSPARPQLSVCVSLQALRRLKAVCVRVAVGPCVLEACVVAVVSHFLLHLPWIWGFILG